jgi:hypothetical protein
MEQLIYKWIRIHDRTATHAKIWQYRNEWHFQCCIDQEPYGGIFAMSIDTHNVRRIN